MTPQLEAAIAAIQPLTLAERQQLIQILTQNSDLKTLSTQFRQGTTVQELLLAQSPKTVHNPKELAADFFPEEDSIEEFLNFLQQQRQYNREP
ncbi:hypothetical protein ACQ4M3_36975 [Leptolyngbya sp. AN03gr2]|uniref:hypothetical protein n=1 Tax=unclassified Leptolyngbya TaxID=2650499 RepID=UPI003D31370D